mmetsp:Transcript_188/g.472  ORF Transcript_188/g.472 Transcript_188/m.472 type:complete len:424 (-) Transcript_188:333-1604(-)
MLRGEVDAPGDWILKLFTVPDRLLQLGHRICVGEAHERGACHLFEALDASRVDHLRHKRQVRHARVEEVPAAEPHVVLSAPHIVLERAEGHLRLNHPEFCQVSSGVGILRPERGAKRVDVGQAAGIILPVELTRDRQVRRFSEKVLGVVDGPILLPLDATNDTCLGLHLGQRLLERQQRLYPVLRGFREVLVLFVARGCSLCCLDFLCLCVNLGPKGFELGGVDRLVPPRLGLRKERRHLEHLASPLAVGCRNDGRVHVQEPVVLEELVRGVGEGVSDARDGPDRVGARPQVCNLPQKLHALLFLGEWILASVSSPQVKDPARLELDLLLGALGGFGQLPLDEHARRRGRHLLQPADGVSHLLVDHDLHVGEATAVVELQERKRAASGRSPGLYPPADTDRLAGHGDALALALQDRGDHRARE